MLTLKDDCQLASVQVIASDMDFTLLADDGSMPDGMDERIAALDAAGIVFVAASGRPSYTLRNMFRNSFHAMAAISDNGAAVSHKGKNVFTSLIPPQEYRRLARKTLDCGMGAPVLCALDRGVVHSSARPHDEYLRSFYHDIQYVDTFDDIELEANKYTVFFPEDNSRQAYTEVFEPLFSAQYSITTAGDRWIDVMNPGIHKGVGITKLCSYLHIDLADVLALGDNYNDIEMLQTVGHPYVMSNAAQPIQAYGRFMAPSNNERGVATVIDAVLAAHGLLN